MWESSNGGIKRGCARQPTTTADAQVNFEFYPRHVHQSEEK